MANYINNETFCKLLTEYRALVIDAKENNKKKPRLSDEIGKAFMQIAVGLSNRNNFNGYSFKEDMIGDAIENCVMAASNFDPAKSKNPFAYFTQISWYAFLRRIQKEKKNLHIMYDLLDQNISNMENKLDYISMDYQDDGLDTNNSSLYNDFILNNDKRRSFLETAEESKEKKKKKRKEKKNNSSNGSATLDVDLE